MSGFITMLIFIGTIIGLFYLDMHSEVLVHLCENDGISTYAKLSPPPTRLTFGECREELMLKKEYYKIKRAMK